MENESLLSIQRFIERYDDEWKIFVEMCFYLNVALKKYVLCLFKGIQNENLYFI